MTDTTTLAQRVHLVAGCAFLVVATHAAVLIAVLGAVRAGWLSGLWASATTFVLTFPLSALIGWRAGSIDWRLKEAGRGGG